MTPQDQKEMETLLDLFEHEGWTIFIDEIEKQLNSLKENAHIECETNDNWQLRRGCVGILSQIVSYENTIKYVAEQSGGEDDSQDI